MWIEKWTACIPFHSVCYGKPTTKHHSGSSSVSIQFTFINNDFIYFKHNIFTALIIYKTKNKNYSILKHFWSTKTILWLSHINDNKCFTQNASTQDSVFFCSFHSFFELVSLSLNDDCESDSISEILAACSEHSTKLPTISSD